MAWVLGPRCVAMLLFELVLHVKDLLYAGATAPRAVRALQAYACTWLSLFLGWCVWCAGEEGGMFVPHKPGRWDMAGRLASQLSSGVRVRKVPVHFPVLVFDSKVFHQKGVCSKVLCSRRVEVLRTPNCPGGLPLSRAFPALFSRLRCRQHCCCWHSIAPSLEPLSRVPWQVGIFCPRACSWDAAGPWMVLW